MFNHSLEVYYYVPYEKKFALEHYDHSEMRRNQKKGINASSGLILKALGRQGWFICRNDLNNTGGYYFNVGSNRKYFWQSSNSSRMWIRLWHVRDSDRGTAFYETTFHRTDVDGAGWCRVEITFQSMPLLIEQKWVLKLSYFLKVPRNFGSNPYEYHTQLNKIL